MRFEFTCVKNGNFRCDFTAISDCRAYATSARLSILSSPFSTKAVLFRAWYGVIDEWLPCGTPKETLRLIFYVVLFIYFIWVWEASRTVTKMLLIYAAIVWRAIIHCKPLHDQVIYFLMLCKNCLWGQRNSQSGIQLSSKGAMVKWIAGQSPT